MNLFVVTLHALASLLDLNVLNVVQLKKAILTQLGLELLILLVKIAVVNGIVSIRNNKLG
jgi:hypothetical protein